MIKNRSFESKFSQKIAQKYEPKRSIKAKKNIQKSMMASGTVVELDGSNKEAFENFFGVALPKIKIHKTDSAIEKAKKYHAHSYAQGNDIYLGKDTKPIDTLEGQTVIAHEITHVIQQKYLDMSSQKEMVDPSVELEKKAQIVEERVRANRGIDTSSGDYFKKWDVLPKRSYEARVASLNKFGQNKVVQRWAWLDKVKDTASSAVNSAKSLGKSAVSGISATAQYSVGLATNIASKGLSVVGADKYAQSVSDVSKSFNKNASKSFQSATTNFSKSAKYLANTGSRIMGKNDIFTKKNIAKTKGISAETIGKGLSNVGAKVGNFVGKHKDTIIEGGLLALNAASAVGKTVVGVGLMGTGIGSVAGAALIAGAALDANDAWKNAQAMKMYATTPKKDRTGDKWKDGVPKTHGIATSLGFKDFDKKYIESKGAKALQFASNFISYKGASQLASTKSANLLKSIGKGFKNPKSVLKGIGKLGKKGLKGVKNLPNMLKSSKFLKNLQNKEFAKATQGAWKGMKHLGKKFIPSKLVPELGEIGSKYLVKSGKFISKNVKNFGKTFKKGVKGVKNVYEGIKSSKLLKHIKDKKFLKYAKDVSKKAGKSLRKGIKNTPKFLQELAEKAGHGIAKGSEKLAGKIKDGLDFGVKKYKDIAKSDFITHIKNKNYLKAGTNIASKSWNGLSNLAGKVDFGASMLGMENVGSQIMHFSWGKENKAKLPDKLSKDSTVKDLILYSYGDLETEEGKKTNEKLFGKEALRLDLHNQKAKKGSTVHPSMQRLMDKGEANDPIFSIDEGIGLQGVLFRNSTKDILSGQYKTSYKVIFRGTDSLQDGLVEDGGKRGTRQAKRAKDIYKGFFTKESSLIDSHNVNKSNPQIGYQDLIFGGHSLGGYIANSVMIDYLGSPSKYGTLKPTEVKSETYNALGVTTKELDKYNNLVSKDGNLNSNRNVKVSSDNYRMAFDPVSQIGVQPGNTIEKSLKYSTFKDKASILYGGAHSMINFYKTLDEKEIKFRGKAGVVDKYVTDNPVTRNIFEKGYNFFKGKPTTPKDHTSQNYQEVKESLIKTADQIKIPTVISEDSRTTKSSDFSIAKEKKNEVYSFPETYINPSFLPSKQTFLSAPKDNVKYAEEGRSDRSISSGKEDTLNKDNNSNDNIDELSMKIFRNLKSEIMLEYSRKG